MKIKLQIGLSAFFTLIIVLIVVVSSWIMYESNHKLALQTAESRMSIARDVALARLKNVVFPVRQLVEKTAKLAGAFPDDTVSPVGGGIIADQMLDLPQVYSAYVAFEATGNFHQVVKLPPTMTEFGPGRVPVPKGATFVHREIDASGSRRHETQKFFADWGTEIGRAAHITKYDPRVRPWYLGALDNDNVFVSEVYQFQSTGELGLTFAKRMLNANGERTGVVGADVTLTQFIDVLKSVRVGNDGKVFFLSERGGLIGFVGSRHDGDHYQFAEGDLTLNDALLEPVISTAVEDWSLANGAYYTFEHEGESYIASAFSIADFFGTTPTLGLVVPEDHFVGSIEDTTASVLKISAIILVVSVVFILWVSRVMARQLFEASTEARNIGQMKLAKDFTLQSFIAEIDSLGDALENMRTALLTFLKYAPRDLVTDIVRSGKPAKIGGSRQQITLMFTDIEGFTSISEKLSPEEVMKLMSDYFEVLTNALTRHNGTVDKFIGDAIMAMWNAPVANPNHVEDACDAALLACRASNELNIQLADADVPKLVTRFGLHSCEALVGNVGASDRMQFTSLGSGVNLASRIEGLNKFYRTQILVSDTIRKNAGPRFLFRRVDLVTAKGTTRPVTVFELLGERDEAGEFYVGRDTVGRAVRYEQAFDFYLHRDFDDAIKILQGLQDEVPDDYVVEVLLEKCSTYLTNPPDAGWDGSTALDEK